MDISLSLDTLSIRTVDAQSATAGSGSRSFHLFPTLPTELRLKIVLHALPSPTTLKLTANILVANPRFGLYLVFQVTPPRLTNPTHQSAFGFGNNALRAPRGWYVEARSLHLLATSREIREYYIEKFPYTIPTGKSAPWIEGGLIRYSSQDAVMFRNFAQLTSGSFAGPLLRRAFREGWNVQELWEDLAQLELGIEVIRPEFVDGCADALAGMKGLRSVKVWLWRGFGEEQAEGVKLQVRRAMEERVKSLEGMVREAREQGWLQEKVAKVHLPTFELMG